MKKWIDASVIASQEAEVHKELWECERLMKEKPNWNHNKDSNIKNRNNEFNIKNKRKGARRCFKNGKNKKTFKTN